MLDRTAYEQRTAWYRQARFGMFIHWGLYAIPARGEWVRSTERMPEADYLPYFREFSAPDFNPRAWAAMARKAGMIPEEPPQGRDRTACCGYGGLVWCAQPELAEAMAGHRAGGLPHAALSSCIMCRDRLAGSGKPGLHLLDLLPQLAPLAHGLEPEKGPGLSERRARRAALRRRLARVWLGQELAEPAAGRLDLVPGLLEELERRHILLEDVDGAVAAVEAEKAYFVDAESGHRLGAWRPRNVTFWVEYTEEDGRWLLHDAWCHRMRVPGSGGVQENGCCGEA